MREIEQCTIPPEIDLSVDPKVINQAKKLLGAEPNIERAKEWIHSPEKKEREKRIAGAILTCLSPLVATSSLGVLMVDGWPPFYADTVAFPGPNKESINPVKMIKIRTLKENASFQEKGPFDTTALKGSRQREREEIDHRVHSWFGKILRKTGLDETPQLLSVINDRMALVGPRGYTPQEIEGLNILLENLEDKKGLENYLEIMGLVAPLSGIAGLYAAIYKKDLTPLERLLLDQIYCLSATREGDNRILVRSLITTLKGTGAR